MLYKSTLKTRNTNAKRLNTLIIWGLSLILLVFYTLPAHAAAASQQRQSTNKIMLSDMNGARVNMIDWRQSEIKLRFDLMESEWTDGIELNLSMDPGENAKRDTQIHVRFNNEKPIVLRAKGQSFDARIRLDNSYARTTGNIITISTSAQNDTHCQTANDGSWNVNFKKSYVTVKSRAKSRSFQIGEVEKRLSNPTTAPKMVAIYAAGAEKARLEMLAAQSIALRMNNIPNYRTTKGKADMQIILAPRDKLTPFVSDKKILRDTGTKISVHKGRPLRLVITGDTDEQVLEAAKQFAAHRLPNIRRNYTSVGEVISQPSFATQKTTISQRTRLEDLNFGTSFGDWTQAPHILEFDANDPSIQNGKVMLHFNVSDKISSNSRIYIDLNGTPLGNTALDKKQKSVAFEIPSSALKGTGNKLTLRPDLFPQDLNQANSCMALTSAPGLSIKSASYIELTALAPSPFSDLSRLTAGSDPFSHQLGANTHVVFAHNRGTNHYSALRIMAKLAKTKGSGWTNAMVTYGNEPSNRTHKFIVGSHTNTSRLLENIPKSLQATLRGERLAQSISDEPQIGKFASNDLQATMQTYAAMQKQARAQNRGMQKALKGGVAAIYPAAPGRLIGLITSTTGQSFSSTSNHLMKANQWKKLTGGVASWNHKSVMVTQIAFPVSLPDMPTAVQSKEISFNLEGLAVAFEDAKRFILELLQKLSAAAGDLWTQVSTFISQKFSETTASTSPATHPSEALNYSENEKSKIGSWINEKAAQAVDSTNTKLEQMQSNSRSVTAANTHKFKDSLTPAESKFGSAIGFQQSSINETAIWNDQRFGKNGLLLIFGVIFLALMMGMTKPRAKQHPRRRY